MQKNYCSNIKIWKNIRFTNRKAARNTYPILNKMIKRINPNKAISNFKDNLFILKSLTESIIFSLFLTIAFIDLSNYWILFAWINPFIYWNLYKLIWLYKNKKGDFLPLYIPKYKWNKESNVKNTWIYRYAIGCNKQYRMVNFFWNRKKIHINTKYEIIDEKNVNNNIFKFRNDFYLLRRNKLLVLIKRKLICWMILNGFLSATLTSLFFIITTLTILVKEKVYMSQYSSIICYISMAAFFIYISPIRYIFYKRFFVNLCKDLDEYLSLDVDIPNNIEWISFVGKNRKHYIAKIYIPTIKKLTKLRAR
ncbi:hypothetical protein ACM0JF_02090 [Mycoplasma sp. 654]|uniref:hypothetical protein n=1 Tax=Mycoplasma sp. 654 TaxID=3398773 RepID=UPI003A861C3A